MSVPTVNVTVAVNDQKGNPVIGATVEAKLTTMERYNGYVVPVLTTGLTGDAGTCVLKLFPNELGTESSEYKFKIIEKSGKVTAIFATIPNVNCSLHQISELNTYKLRGAGQIVTSEIAGYTSNALSYMNAAASSAIDSANSANVAMKNKDTALIHANSAATQANNAAASAVIAGSREVGATNSAAAALTSETNANTAKVAAEAARDVANTHKAGALAAQGIASQWAENAENVVVETGKYSAKHHAAKSAASAASALTYKDTATTKAADATTQAGLSLGYANESKGYRDTAALHAADALASKNAAQISKEGAATSAANAIGGATTATEKAASAATSEVNAANSKTACDGIYANVLAIGHTHSNKAVLDATEQSFTSALKTKLDGVAASANNYAHPTGDGNRHVPATGTTNNGKVLKAGATAASEAWGTLAKGDVGLGNVDNTTDALKPISTAAQNALNLKVSKDSDTGVAYLPAGTTAQRPTLASNVRAIRYNTDILSFEGWSGTAWGSIGGGAKGGGSNGVFYENDNAVTADYSITSGKNAMSAGPITINDNVTVTIPDGSVWTIV